MVLLNSLILLLELVLLAKQDARLALLLLLVVKLKMDTIYISQKFMLALKIANNAHLHKAVLNAILDIHMSQHIELVLRHHVYLVNIMIQQIINVEIVNQIVKRALQLPLAQTVMMDFI